MKSIKIKIILVLVFLLALVCIGFGTSSYLISSRALISNVNSELPELAKQGAAIVDKYLDDQWNSLEILALNDTIVNNKSDAILNSIKNTMESTDNLAKSVSKFKI